MNSSILTASGHAATVFGFDDSHYEPGIDYAKAKAAGYAFAGSKATDGAHGVDSTYARKRKEAHAAGIIHFPYHFWRFNDDPAAQVEHMLAVTSGPQVGELPHCVDVEWDNQANDHGYRDNKHGGTRQSLDNIGAKRVLTGLQLLEQKSGLIPIMYTAIGFFTNVDLSLVQEFSRYRLWLAQPGAKVPTLPHGLSNWTFFQNTFHDKVPGSEAAGADGDIYNGSLDQLKALMRQA